MRRCLATDGAFEEHDAEVRFLPAPAPTSERMTAVLARVHRTTGAAENDDFDLSLAPAWQRRGAPLSSCRGDRAMTYFDPASGRLNVKVVYYGPPNSGKASNLQHIYDRIRPEDKGKLIRLGDRYEFFDFTARRLSTALGRAIRLHLYAVHARDEVRGERKSLVGTDALVAVVDTHTHTLDSSAQVLADLRLLISKQGRDLDDLPLVFQYNKRDLSGELPLAVLEARLNPQRRPYVEAVATTGVGVLETLRTVTDLLTPCLPAGLR